MKRPPSPTYRQLWRVVDGAVIDALRMHPDYLTERGRINARRSIVKRVAGALQGYVEQSTQGRSGAEPAATAAPILGSQDGASLRWTVSRKRHRIRGQDAMLADGS